MVTLCISEQAAILRPSSFRWGGGGEMVGGAPGAISVRIVMQSARS